MSDADRARWNQKYRAAEPSAPAPSPALTQLASWLPATGAALDLAAGRGADARWLAQRGLEVTATDVSDEAIARAREVDDGRVRWIRIDLEADPLPTGPFALVTCSNYLQRNIWPDVLGVLRPGGRVVWIHPTTVNLERNAKPSARFLLKPGEATSLLERAGLRVLWSEQAWTGPQASPRHLSRVVAEKPATAPAES